MEIRESSIEFEPTLIGENRTRESAPSRRSELLTIVLQNTKLEFIRIPHGSFLMGAPEAELGSRSNERPLHRVAVESFYLGRIPITQGQWKAVAGSDCRGSQNTLGDELPAVNVWLDEAITFCRILSKIIGKSFRLPSEAEWEYACRAGTETAFCYGESLTPEIANYADPDSAGEGIRHLTKAGHFDAPNAFGLLDMHGNIWEWCSDVWHEDYEGAPTDGTAWVSGGDRGYCVQRGGSWRSPMSSCRSAMRVGDIARNDEGIVGIRVCFTP